MKKSEEKVLMLSFMGILTAIVVVMQAMAVGIRLGTFSVALVIVPIVVGAALYGVKAGAWLGFVFSVVVLFTDSAAFMTINPAGTVITVILKGTLAGVAAALVYRPLEKRSVWLAAVAAALAAQIVNKALFLLGCVVFFLGTIREWAAGAGYDSIVIYLFFGLTGLNFLVETPVNILLSTVIVRVLEYAKTRIRAKA